MPTPSHTSHKRTSRHATYQKRQQRFFSIIFGLIATGVVVGLIWLISRSPGSIH